MSYILEALKKAEAERQLGRAPDLHALPVQAPAARLARSARVLLWCAVGLAGAGALALAWQNRPARPAAPVTVASAPARPAPAPAPVAEGPLFAPAPVVAQPAPVASPAPAPAEAAPEPVEPVPAPPPEDTYPYLRDLPEAVAREIPPLAIGGYIYSPNPAERLLLIDKVLRHEGEEVAPGLTLEKLQPKAAVFNYRGFRYRVAY